VTAIASANVIVQPTPGQVAPIAAVSLTLAFTSNMAVGEV
jgi:hypothetical protein